jgi:DNA-binding IclR family transcriptional regulator
MQAVRLTSSSLKEAQADLALFNRDPLAFVESSRRRKEANQTLVTINMSRVTDFLQALATKGTTTLYRKNTRFYLDLWSKRLGERDLRRVTLADLSRQDARSPQVHRGHQVVQLVARCPGNDPAAREHRAVSSD